MARDNVRVVVEMRPAFILQMPFVIVHIPNVPDFVKKFLSIITNLVKEIKVSILSNPLH
jgi:hypothetical protein